MTDQDPKIEAIRQRRADVIDMLRKGSPEAPTPSVRAALEGLMAELKAEKQPATEKLLAAHRDRLREATVQIANALAFDKQARDELVFTTFEGVEHAHRHARHVRTVGGRDFDDVELEIQALTDAYKKQRELLQWIEKAKGPSEGGSLAGYL